MPSSCSETKTHPAWCLLYQRGGVPGYNHTGERYRATRLGLKNRTMWAEAPGSNYCAYFLLRRNQGLSFAPGRSQGYLVDTGLPIGPCNPQDRSQGGWSMKTVQPRKRLEVALRGSDRTAWERRKRERTETQMVEGLGTG